MRWFNGRFVEDAQSVLRIRRHQFGSPLRSDAGEQITTQELVRVVGAEIPGHHLDPHQHVGSGPWRRPEAQQRELRRQRRIGGEKRIHAGAVRLDLTAGIVGQPLPGGARRASEPDRPQEPVLRNRRGAEDFRQHPVPDSALELHLPQPVLGVDEAETEERVPLGRREDVRDGVGVAHDLHRSRESFDVNGAAHLRQRPPAVEIRPRGHRCYDDDEYGDGDQ